MLPHLVPRRKLQQAPSISRAMAGSGIQQLADRGRPYAALIEQPDLARRALAQAWDEPVVVPPGAWQLPAGAFGEGTGPG